MIEDARDPFSTDKEAFTILPTIRIAGDVTMKPGTGLGPRKLREYELLYFPDGSNTVYQVEDTAYNLKEPCFILSRPNESHTYYYDPKKPCRHLFIHFYFDSEIEWQPLQDILKKNGPSYIPNVEDLYVLMMKQILHIAYSIPDRIQQRGSSLLLSLLEELNGQIVDEPLVAHTDRIPPQILKALDYIENNLNNPLSIEQLAQSVGWTHEHFSRLFTQHMGRTPRETIIQQRIEKACQLLLYEDWTIKQIAYKVGFLDENYFSRVFKTSKGMTATSYRKKFSNPRYKEFHPASEADTMYPQNRILFNKLQYLQK